MMADSSQKFIARNRAPRVQIEYDVELYGAEKKIQLPFVMGVMADLSGKPVEDLPEVSERDFLEFDVDNFNDRMKAMKPRVAFQVPNVLTNDGNISVDITFENMNDLITYMDGKGGAEKKINELLNDPALLKSLVAIPKPQDEGSEISENESK